MLLPLNLLLVSNQLLQKRFWIQLRMTLLQLGQKSDGNSTLAVALIT